MVDDTEKARHWRYYLILERDFETVLRYIEPDPRNHQVFSLELAKQLLSIAAQFETIVRLYCQERIPGSVSTSMPGWAEDLVQYRAEFPIAIVTFMTRNEPIKPFAEWGQTPVASTDWWRAYNKIKHDPLAGLEGATLISVRDALAGLALLTFAYATADNVLRPSEVFALNRWHDYL